MSEEPRFQGQKMEGAASALHALISHIDTVHIVVQYGQDGRRNYVFEGVRMMAPLQPGGQPLPVDLPLEDLAVLLAEASYLNLRQNLVSHEELEAERSGPKIQRA